MSRRFHSPPLRKPAGSPRPDRDRSGSLLAETLLVLPLYLMLLGGLFIVGDLLLARIRGGVLDRTAAWLRRGGAFSVGTVAEHHRVWEGTGTSFGWYGMKIGDPADPSVSPVRSWGVRVEDNAESGTGAGVPTQGNRWVGFYQGVSFVSAGVPFWVPLLDSQENVYSPDSGSEGTPSLYRIHPDHPGWKRTSDVETLFGRSYVFTRRRRNPTMSDPPPLRSATIQELREPNGGYQDIVLDDWPCLGEIVGTVVPISTNYVRNASAKTLAEQSYGSVFQ